MLDFELTYKSDAPAACRRLEAWWRREILDRPCIQVAAPRPNPAPLPPATHASLRDRWMDAEYAVACADAQVANTYWGGELLPTFTPNLGPEVLTAGLGAELIFSDGTSWSEPLLFDWEDIPRLRLDPTNEYVSTILEMTRLALEIGQGKFITGITDLHTGADLAASLRDPQQLCLDLVEEPERVRQLSQQIQPAFFEFYELQHSLMRSAGQSVTTTWLPLWAEGRYYVPHCDFSCMISTALFQDFFLPGIVEEIRWLDRSIFHLDGPGALRHLDLLLEIQELDAVQWVYGAGNEPASQWMSVCRRIQDAGKCLHISLEPDDIQPFLESLRPEGVMLSTWAPSPEAADALVERVRRWGG